MTNKGNQATFILPPEPQADNELVYTFIRKKGALSMEITQSPRHRRPPMLNERRMDVDHEQGGR